MRCHQCSKAAFYQVGKDASKMVPLCLSCYVQLEHVNMMKFLQNAAMMNHAEAQMDAVVGLPPLSKPIPVAEIARAMAKSHTFNNIKISNSNVGVVNTGNLARIDAAITMSQHTDMEEFGARLKDLTDAILSDTKASKDEKQELAELTQAISDQVIGQKRPSGVVVATLFDKVRGLCGDFTTIAAAAEKLHDAWQYLQSGGAA